MSIETPLKNKIQHKLGLESIQTQSPTLTNTFLYKTAHAAAHDLRSPLFVIRSYGHLLQKTQEKERLQRGFKLMEEATYRMEKTINEYVGLMDIYTTPFPQKEIVSFESAFESACHGLERLINQVQPKISTNFNTYPRVSFNKKYLIYIITYLVDNAIRHNVGKEDLQIKVSSKKIGNDLVLIVQDNGKGIEDAKEQEKIKDAFYSYSEDQECIGMGLPKVQAIAQVSQNMFNIQSQPQQFTSCHFVFKN